MTMKIFVGCSVKEALPLSVLTYSIMRNTDSKVQVVPLFEFDHKIPKVKRRDARPRTPFSFQRFLIPWANMYSGRAVYMDSDMLVFDDVAELFDRPMGSADVLTPPRDDRGTQFAVMVIDCAVCRWDISHITARLEEGSLSYRQLMSMKGLGMTVSSCLGKRWNELDVYSQDTKLMHFTKMELQPWLARGHPYQHIWAKALRDAVADGFVSKDIVEWEVEAGHVRQGVLGMLKG